ncbi:uncharacterized protein LOC136034185 [Artemia franciscana]
MVYPPTLSVTFGKSLEGKSLKEGDDVYFECHVVANPAPLRVEWRHNGQRISQCVNKGVIINDRSLVLQKISRSQGGRYTCAAWNEEGGSESEPVLLNLQYIPVCLNNQSRVYVFAIGDQANLECVTDAEPKPTYFRWMMNSSSDMTDLASSNDRALNWTINSEHDTGDILCWSSNELGQQTVPCLYHVLLAGKPEPIQNCTVSNQTSTSLFISCIEGFNGGVTSWFTLNVLDASLSSSIINLTNSEPQFMLENLEAGTEYRITVAAVNLYGFGGSRSFTIHTPMERAAQQTVSLTAEASRPKLTWSPAITTALAFSIATLFILVAILTALRKRKSQPLNSLPRVQSTEEDVFQKTVPTSETNITMSVLAPKTINDGDKTMSRGKIISSSPIMETTESISLLSVTETATASRTRNSVLPSYCTNQRKHASKRKLSEELHSFDEEWFSTARKQPKAIEQLSKEHCLPSSSGNGNIFSLVDNPALIEITEEGVSVL